jgi:exonuclease III
MIMENMLIWNARGLNARTKRDMVRSLVAQEQIPILTLQQSKLDACDDNLILNLCGAGYDFFDLPSSHTSGGILLAWRRDVWTATNVMRGRFSLSAKISLIEAAEKWWLTCVYGPQLEEEKIFFLDELRQVKNGCEGTWMVCGDFNIIYRAHDKNNSRLNRRMMNHFQRFIDEVELLELNLHGRLYTWSNEREDPTLERIDRVF